VNADNIYIIIVHFVMNLKWQINKPLETTCLFAMNKEKTNIVCAVQFNSIENSILIF